jgi:hypothetical protein
LFRIREATRDDQRALADLESVSPQGDSLQILIEREDYFYRSALLGRGKVLLAEEDGRVVGVMAYALKDVLLSGSPTRAAYFYDLRAAPDYRRSMRRGLYRLWKATEAEAIAGGAALFYGFVKEDNSASLRVTAKGGASPVGTFGILSLSSLPRRESSPLPPLAEGEIPLGIQAVEEASAGHDLRPLDLSEIYRRGRELGYLRGIWRLDDGRSFAQASVWNLSRVYRGVVLRMPASLTLLRLALNPFAAIFPLPRVPRVGERVASWTLFDLLRGGSNGEGLLDRLIRRLQHQAAEEDIQLLTAFSYLDPPGTPLPRRFLGKLLRYRTMVKPIAAPLPEGPLYLDVRDA